MRRRSGQAALVASPVLVGAVTVLVACIAVLISVQANQGLPFVPTYELKAELPGGANLVKGNDVRIGGNRIGVVDEIVPGVRKSDEGRAIAVITMMLDKRIEPLASDTKVLVRPRSALGLKYIELQPGRGARPLASGATLPLSQTESPIEIDEFFGMFDDPTRRNQRTALEGFGTALSGRGTGINEAIRDFAPFMRSLDPVMTALSDPDTELDRFFVNASAVAGQIAPVADTYADLFGNMGTTFEALSRHPDQLRGTIERAAPTIEEGIRSFPVQRPFLRDSAELARALEPVADQIPVSLPPTSAALRTAAPVLRKAPPFYRRTRNVFDSLDQLASNPNTLLGVRDLRRLLETGTPLVEWVAPYQTVCNYFNYFFTGLSEHISEPVRGGTIQRVNLKTGTLRQSRRLNTSDGERPVDVPFDESSRTARDETGQQPLQALRAAAYSPALDPQGNANCQTGQRGFVEGPYVPNGRYGPRDEGGQKAVQTGNFPLVHGPTYRSRELGIRHLRDVP